MLHIMMHWLCQSTTDHMYDSDPIDSNGALFPVRNGKLCGLGRILFSSDGIYICGRLAVDSLSFMEPQFWVHRLQPKQSGTDLIQHRGDCSPRATFSDRAIAISDLGW